MSLLLGLLLAQNIAMDPVMPVKPIVPFAVGETFSYKAKAAPTLITVTVGNAKLSVVSIDTIRGIPCWQFALDEVGNLGGLWSNKTEMRSWTTLGDFTSLLFTKHLVENGKLLRDDHFKIYPDSGFYRNNADEDTRPVPPQPLDDLSFIYFARTITFKNDTVYHFPQYYRKDGGDVTVTVLRREKMKLPDGSSVNCVVLHPVVNEKNGMFREGAKAKLWISDDARRIPVRIETSYPLVTIWLELDSMTLPKMP